MKKNLRFILLTALCFAVASTAVAGHHEGAEHRIEMKIMQDGELIEISADDLEVGESKQYISDSGKEVVLTRLEDGLTLTVDGEEIDLGGGHGMHVMRMDGDDDGKIIKKIVKRIECDDEDDCERHHEVKIHKHKMKHKHQGEKKSKMVFITKGDGGAEEDHEMIFIGDDEDMEGVHKKIIRVERKSAIEQLEADGVLDQLSAADREAVVNSLKKLEGERKIKVKVLGDGDDENIWISDDGEVHHLGDHDGEIEIEVEVEEEH